MYTRYPCYRLDSASPQIRRRYKTSKPMQYIREPSVIDETDLIEERDGRYWGPFIISCGNKRLDKVLRQKHWDATVVIDEAIYRHFLEIFWAELHEFLASNYPRQWQDVSAIESAKGGAAAFGAAHSNIALLRKHFKKWQRWRKTFHLYNDQLFSYAIYDTFEPENGLQVVRLESEDLVDLLNAVTISAKDRLFKSLRQAI